MTPTACAASATAYGASFYCLCWRSATKDGRPQRQGGRRNLVRHEPVEAEDKSTQWHNTGDVGYCDVEGYLHHVDRQSNVITVDGIRYYPEQMEHVLSAIRGWRTRRTGTAPGFARRAHPVVQTLDWPPLASCPMS